MSTDVTPGEVAAPAAEVAPAPDVAVASPPSEPSAVEAAPEPTADVSEAPTTEPVAEAAAETSLVESAEPVAESAAEAAETVEPVEEPKPTYEAFTFPEGVTVDEAELAPFTEILGEIKADQESGQKLIDMHASALQRYADHLQQKQQDAFAETRQGWRTEFEKGAGNRRDTILNDAKSAISAAIPDEKARKALWDVLSYTGAGDNPHVINAFAKLGERLRERSAPPPPTPHNPAKSGRAADRRYAA